MQLYKANTHDGRTTTVLHNHLAVYYLQDTAPQHSFKGKTPGKARGRLDIAGLYKSRSCGDRKGSERPGWLPATFVVTRWGDPRRSFDTADGATRLGRPRPRVRPGGSGLSDDASEERTGLCSFNELMLF